MGSDSASLGGFSSTLGVVGSALAFGLKKSPTREDNRRLTLGDLSFSSFYNESILERCATQRMQANKPFPPWGPRPESRQRLQAQPRRRAPQRQERSR